jgi:hypothetical protein
MTTIIIVAIIAAVAYYIYYMSHGNYSEQTPSEQPPATNQPRHFYLLDENGDPIGAPNAKIVIDGGDSDAPVLELKYFCVKDKGYHVSVWPKDHSQFDIVEFNIAGMSHRDNIDGHLGEFKGTLEAEPTNEYDPNAIKVLAADGHHVGYVPKDMTDEIRDNVTLPCQCFCYIGENDGVYFSDCYILRPNVSPK